MSGEPSFVGVVVNDESMRWPGLNEHRAKSLYFCNDKIKEGSNPRRALKIPMHEQVKGCYEFRPDIEQAYEVTFSISDADM